MKEYSWTRSMGSTCKRVSDFSILSRKYHSGNRPRICVRSDYGARFSGHIDFVTRPLFQCLAYNLFRMAIAIKVCSVDKVYAFGECIMQRFDRGCIVDLSQIAAKLPRAKTDLANLPACPANVRYRRSKSSIAAVFGVDLDARKCWRRRGPSSGRLYSAVQSMINFLGHIVADGKIHDAFFKKHTRICIKFMTDERGLAHKLCFGDRSANTNVSRRHNIDFVWRTMFFNVAQNDRKHILRLVMGVHAFVDPQM